MTYGVRDAPFPVVQPAEVEAVHPPVVASVEIIVAGDAEQDESDSREYWKRSAVELGGDDGRENCREQKRVADCLEDN